MPYVVPRPSADTLRSRRPSVPVQRLHQSVRAKASSRSPLIVSILQTPLTSRSDVLLRHRRRCHPTPPPADRSSNSPPPPHRNYPGVPISSSRTDAREASPDHRGRKHPRQSSSSSHDGAQSAQRRRTDEEEDDDDDQYGESSRFGRQNGMGNGGVYGMSNNFYGSSSESSTYTPHLLPMFQQTQPGGYHNLNNPNHLEDASVLLSMAYPGGVPAPGDNGMVVGGQRVVPDWEAGQSINMMMEATNDGNSDSRTTSVSSVPADLPATAENQAVLPEMGNFLGTMNWLSGGANTQGKEGNTGEGTNGWVRLGLLTPLKNLELTGILYRWSRQIHRPSRSRPFRSLPSSPLRRLG